MDIPAATQKPLPYGWGNLKPGCSPQPNAVDYNQPQQSFKGNGITQSSSGSTLGFWVGKFMIHCGGVEI